MTFPKVANLELVDEKFITKYIIYIENNEFRDSSLYITPKYILYNIITSYRSIQSTFSKHTYNSAKSIMIYTMLVFHKLFSLISARVNTRFNFKTILDLRITQLRCRRNIL